MLEDIDVTEAWQVTKLQIKCLGTLPFSEKIPILKKAIF